MPEVTSPPPAPAAAPDAAAVRRVFPPWSRRRAVVDELAAALDRAEPTADGWYRLWAVPRVAETVATLRPFVRPGMRVLDLASGSYFSYMMSAMLPGVEWAATDTDSGVVEFRDRTTGEQLYRYDPVPLTLEDGRTALPGSPPADVVTMFEVVEHLPWNPGGLFGSVNEYLPAGGLFALSTPNICARSAVFRQLRGGSPHQTPLLARGPHFHRREFTPYELRLLLEWAGFRVERLATANVYVSDRFGWFGVVHSAALLAAAVLSFSPGAVRNWLRFSGSTTFVVARKVGPVRWGDEPPVV